MSHITGTGDLVAYNDAKHVVVMRLIGFPDDQLVLANIEDASILHASVNSVTLVSAARYDRFPGEAAVRLDKLEEAACRQRNHKILDIIRHNLDELEMLCPGRDPRERYRPRYHYPEFLFPESLLRTHMDQDQFAKEYLGDWSVTGRLVDKGDVPDYQNIPPRTSITCATLTH